MKYEVYVDDNFHYMDESYRYKAGEFDTEGGAIAFCKKIVDESLPSAYQEGMTFENLYEQYVYFGEDPFIISDGPGKGFSARSYAKERISMICEQKISKAPSMLEKAIAVAIQTHEGQQDLSGAPYILHPLRVMMKMNTELEMVVAVMHDVIEDGNISLKSLEGEGFTSDILDALDSISCRENQDESYEQYIERASGNAIARKVKVADLEDNMNIFRISSPTEKDLNRIMKYKRAWQRLKNGDPGINSKTSAKDSKEKEHAS